MARFVPFMLRWAARLSALFVAGTYALFLAGELFSRPSAFPTQFREWTGVLLLTGTCAGMILAWRKELTGALISLLTLAAFGVLIPMGQAVVPLIASIPGTLYVMDWMLRRSLSGSLEAGGPRTV